MTAQDRSHTKQAENRTLFHHNLRRRIRFRSRLFPNAARDAAIGLRLIRIRPRHHNRRAGIGQFPDFELERQFA